MPEYEYLCRECGWRMTRNELELDGERCVRPDCPGHLSRVYSLWINRVQGGGGSPGKAIGS